MKQVYEQAQVVIVWLGESGASSRLVKELLVALAAAKTDMDSVENPKETIKTVLAKAEQLFPDADAWLNLRILLMNDWWSRAWIVQELLVASNINILFGSVTLEWSTFERAVEFFIELYTCRLEGLLNDTSDPGWELELAEERKGQKIQWGELHFLLMLYSARLIESRRLLRDGRPINLLSLLVQNWGRGASDPRDKVFAFLGLAADAHAGSINADYSRTTKQIYKRVVPDIITRQQNLDVLNCGRKAGTVDRLPSWCPNWALKASDHNWLTGGYISVDSTEPAERLATVETAITPFFDMSDEKVCSAGNTAPAVRFSKKLDMLYATGVRVDIIKDITPELSRFDSSATTISTKCLSLTLHSMKYSPLYFTSETWLAALAGTLKLGKVLPPGGRTYRKLGKRPPERNKNDIDSSVLYGSQNQPDDLSYKAKGAESKAAVENSTEVPLQRLGKGGSIFDRQSLSYAHPQRYLTTSKGLVGVTCFRPQKGDMICVLLGGKSPFILRQQDDHWILVGACYGK